MKYLLPSKKNIISFIVIISAVFLTACDETLYDGLSQREATKIIAVLLENDITATKTKDKDKTYTITVSGGNLSEAVQILDKHDLPREKYRSMGDIFSNDQLVASPYNERARMTFALSQELSRTLSEIDGIVSARVHLAIAKKDPLSDQPEKATASVFLKHDDSINPNIMTAKVKMLVANGIKDLHYEDVSVAWFPAYDINSNNEDKSGENSKTYAQYNNRPNFVAYNDTSPQPEPIRKAYSNVDLTNKGQKTNAIVVPKDTTIKKMEKNRKTMNVVPAQKPLIKKKRKHKANNSEKNSPIRKIIKGLVEGKDNSNKDNRRSTHDKETYNPRINRYGAYKQPDRDYSKVIIRRGAP